MLAGEIDRTRSAGPCGPARPVEFSFRSNSMRGPMPEKKMPGRKTPPGAKKQLLTSMDPEIIRRIKSAAALREITPSLMMEQAAAEWLEPSRRQEER